MHDDFSFDDVQDSCTRFSIHYRTMKCESDFNRGSIAICLVIDNED